MGDEFWVLMMKEWWIMDLMMKINSYFYKLTEMIYLTNRL